ncbi:hypothetical protein [Bacillus alkalicellulosilyticus]|uniref:hypothetical protein n=1 Tax=Alkalihalobacterium alkalicellulosilyticum TaxID=1912214 RepID=UPI000997E715|nr:hypothetical protein [Bacillus alkalicellulosilyticus]
MYFRYHVNYISPKTGMPVGIFVAVGHLVDERRMLEEEIQTYWEQRKYFEEVLPVPPFYWEGNPLGAVTWFKENKHTDKLINQMTFYFEMLRKYDVALVKTKSDNPGKIIYEDDYQVAVIKD